MSESNIISVELVLGTPEKFYKFFSVWSMSWTASYPTSLNAFALRGRQWGTNAHLCTAWDGWMDGWWWMDRKHFFIWVQFSNIIFLFKGVCDVANMTNHEENNFAKIWPYMKTGSFYILVKIKLVMWTPKKTVIWRI